MEKIKIALLDDDYLIVSLLKSFFNAREDVEVVFDATEADQLYQYLEQNHDTIQVLLLDLKMKEINGLDVFKIINEQYPDIKVVIVSSHYQTSTIGFMIKEGVSGFIPKGISPFELVEVVKQVHQKGFYFTAEQIETLRGQIAPKVPKLVLSKEDSLTDREIEIIRLLCQHKTAKEIGEILFIAQRTVEGHKNNLFLKIGVKNVTGLVVYALQKQIVKLEELPLQ